MVACTPPCIAATVVPGSFCARIDGAAFCLVVPLRPDLALFRCFKDELWYLRVDRFS
jgi:hypothetical protein